MFINWVAGNACGTVAILHAVANCSTVTGGEVALRKLVIANSN